MPSADRTGNAGVPYLSEREWGTVREDYSADSDTWGYFTHEQARSRAYRWGEDRTARDTIANAACALRSRCGMGVTRFLKERLFGLTALRAITART